VKIPGGPTYANLIAWGVLLKISDKWYNGGFILTKYSSGVKIKEKRGNDTWHA
jgi:hypothetical protein